MPTLTLDGDTLGKKRKHYNKLVEDTIANKHYELSDISKDDSDIDNLLKIDIASRNRNVDYIIEVMKSKDMLYAATAIKKSTWLITEQQYANIINPEYLHTQLLPSMNTKTFNKLMLHIRLNLKDESRVEAFYEYLKQTDSAYKWLQNCSIPFIENVIKNERLIPLCLFKRLCKRSAHFIDYHTRVDANTYNTKKEILFLLKSHSSDILNILENDDYKCFPILGKKKTNILMKAHSKKVFDNFEKYVNVLDLSVVMHYLNKNETKTFLYEQVKRKYGLHLLQYETLGHFIKNMPEEERFDFVKKTFIDKTELAVLYPEYEKDMINWLIKPYQWYEYAPFNVALTELKKVIRKEHPTSKRIAILSVLITCARKNPEHIKILLQLFKENHINEPLKYRIQFVNNLLSQISTHELDAETWNILDQLFRSVEVYTESNKNVQMCLQSITLYKVLHDEPVPNIVAQKMKFNTLKTIQKTLNQEQSDKIFNYLLHSVLAKVQSENIVNESDFSETVLQLKNVLTLLKDWKKDISNYPSVLDKIQELIKIKQQNMWKTNMACLYNIKKSWRKHMFEESLSLCLCEKACLNALKHKPQLLTRHDKEIDTLRTNDAVSLRRLLAKLRVYWPHSLAQHWTDAYFLSFNKPTGQKAVIKGLFSLLHQSQIIDMAKNHMPDDSKVTWGETDLNEITIRKNIAKNLHIARPPIPLNVILWYAKGDYLQYTVPSLNAILSNMSELESLEYLPKLLDAPVSLQKFGLHLAAAKLKSEDLKSVFLNTWKTSKNLTIRTILFNHTYDHICKATNPTIQKEIWEILSTFIDNLTAEESADIYKKICKVQNVPISIRAEFYMKSYKFLISLPASANCEMYVKELIQYAPKIMDSLDSDFVVDKMLSPAGTTFCTYGTEVLGVFACYVLCGKSEEDQLQRFKRVIEPAMDEAFHLWGSTRSRQYYVKDNFKNFLSHLFWNFRVYYLANKTLPVQLFVKIKTKMEKELPLLENYVLYTSWKLLTEYVKIMDEHKSTLSEMFKSSNIYDLDFNYRWMSDGMESIWKDIHEKISPTLGQVIVKRLKEDTEQFTFSTLYCLFTDAFENMFGEFGQDNEIFMLETLKHMLIDKDFIPSYFLVSKATPKYYYSNLKTESILGIRTKIESHPSKTVRMHYCNDFRISPKNLDHLT